MALPAAPLPGAPLVPPPRLFTLRDGRSLAFSFFGPPLHREEADAASNGTSGGTAGGAGAAAVAAPPGQRLPPILYFHGFCSSRFEAGLLHADALHYGLSVVAVDRPGAGHSTLNPKQASSCTQPSCPVASAHGPPLQCAMFSQSWLPHTHAQSVESMAEDARQLLDHLGMARVAVMGASGGLDGPGFLPAAAVWDCCSMNLSLEFAVCAPVRSHVASSARHAWPQPPSLPRPCVQAARRLPAPVPRCCLTACRRWC